MLIVDGIPPHRRLQVISRLAHLLQNLSNASLLINLREGVYVHRIAMCLIANINRIANKINEADPLLTRRSLYTCVLLLCATFRRSLRSNLVFLSAISTGLELTVINFGATSVAFMALSPLSPYLGPMFGIFQIVDRTQSLSGKS